MKPRSPYNPEPGTIFSTWQNIPDPESSDDARCLLDSYEKRGETDWEFVYLRPEEIRNAAVVFRGWSHERLKKFAGEELISEVEERGIDHPLSLSGDNLEGNHRLAAALCLKLAEVPVYRAR
jgi:hypothetical protein